MEYIVFLSLALGYSAGGIYSYRVAASLIGMVHRKCLQKCLQAKFCRPLGFTGAIIAVVPGFFLAMLVGGSLGGNYGELALNAIGAEKAGVFIGIAIGVCAVFSFIVCFGATIGILIGLLLNGLTCRRPVVGD